MDTSLGFTSRLKKFVCLFLSFFLGVYDFMFKFMDNLALWKCVRQRDEVIFRNGHGPFLMLLPVLGIHETMKRAGGKLTGASEYSFSTVPSDFVSQNSVFLRCSTGSVMVGHYLRWGCWMINGYPHHLLGKVLPTMYCTISKRFWGYPESFTSKSRTDAFTFSHFSRCSYPERLTVSTGTFPRGK